MFVWGGISGMVSNIRCMHLTVVLKHRQRLGQEQEKPGRRRKYKKPPRAEGLISMVFAGAYLPQFWAAGSWQKKFPSPEVQEEGTHQHVFAIKLRQFDSPTAHPLCHSAHHWRSRCPHPSLIVALKYKLFILIYFRLVASFEQQVNSSPSPRASVWKHNAPPRTATKKRPRASRAELGCKRFRAKVFRSIFCPSTLCRLKREPYLAACQMYCAVRLSGRRLSLITCNYNIKQKYASNHWCRRGMLQIRDFKREITHRDKKPANKDKTPPWNL